jgi:hypothetical protein
MLIKLLPCLLRRTLLVYRQFLLISRYYQILHDKLVNMTSYINVYYTDVHWVCFLMFYCQVFSFSSCFSHSTEAWNVSNYVVILGLPLVVVTCVWNIGKCPCSIVTCLYRISLIVLWSSFRGPELSYMLQQLLLIIYFVIEYAINPVGCLLMFQDRHLWCYLHTPPWQLMT